VRVTACHGASVGNRRKHMPMTKNQAGWKATGHWYYVIRFFSPVADTLPRWGGAPRTGTAGTEIMRGGGRTQRRPGWM